MLKDLPKQLATWFWRIVGLILLALSVMICLSGCTTQTIVKPSEPIQIPTALTETSTPLAESFSQKAQDYLARVTTWLESSQEKKTQSSK